MPSSFTCGGCCSACQEASVGALYDTRPMSPMKSQGGALLGGLMQPPSYAATYDRNLTWGPRPMLQQAAPQPALPGTADRSAYERAARVTQTLISEYNTAVQTAISNHTAADTASMRALAARLIMAGLRAQAQTLRQLAQSIDEQRSHQTSPEVRLTGRVRCQDPSGRCSFYYMPTWAVAPTKTWQMFFLPNGTEATVLNSYSGGNTQVRVMWNGQETNAFVKTSSLVSV